MPKRRQQIADGVDDRDSVRARLPLNGQGNYLLTVVTAGQTIIRDPVDDVAEVAQHHRSAVAVSDNQFAIALGVRDLSVSLNGQGLMDAIERADPKARLAALQSGSHIVDANGT